MAENIELVVNNEHNIIGQGEQLFCEVCNGKIDKEDKFTEEKHCVNCGWF